MRSFRKVFGVSFGSIAALALAMAAKPQAPAQQTQEPPQEPGIRRQVNLIDLFVTVRDKNKRIITDLKKEDFKILEDGQEQKIAFFSKEVTLPITLALLLDTSGSEQNMLDSIQEAGSSFLRRVLRKGDVALVMSFDTDVDLLADFTDDKRELDRAVRSTRINTPMSSGPFNDGPVPTRHVTGTALYDAIYLASNEKLSAEAGRKAIVIVSDAQDEGSRVNEKEAIEAAQRTDSVVHVLLVADRRNFGANPGVAHKLADETGGRMISVTSDKKMMAAFDEISDELRSQYTLGYYSTNPKHDGGLRKINVEMTDHDLHALTRKGYYAPKDGSSAEN